MNNPPDWLPPLLYLSEEWNKDIEKLHEIFTNSFIENQCFFEKQLIFVDKRLSDGKEQGFWHLVTKTDEKANERFFDNQRAKRLPWCRPLIENCYDASVKTFNWLHSNNKIRTHIWLEEFDYIVILQPFPNGKAASLITAYFIEGDSTRKKFIDRYDKRIK